MSAIRIATTVESVMSERGEHYRARRTAIGMSVSALAKRAGVDRGSLANLEEGKGVRDTTVAQIERTLSDLEHELGMDVPSAVASPGPASAEPIRLTFHDVFGVGEIIAEGPADKPDELVAAVAALLAQLRAEGGQ